MRSTLIRSLFLSGLCAAALCSAARAQEEPQAAAPAAGDPAQKRVATNAMSFGPPNSGADTVVASCAIPQGARFNLGEGNDIFTFGDCQGQQVKGPYVATGTGEDYVRVQNFVTGPAEIHITGSAGHKEIVLSGGPDRSTGKKNHVWFDGRHAASSVNIFQARRIADVVHIDGATQVTLPGSTGSIKVSGADFEDEIHFKNFAVLVLHNEPPGKFDWVSRRQNADGQFPPVVTWSYATRINASDVTPVLTNTGAQTWVLSFKRRTNSPLSKVPGYKPEEDEAPAPQAAAN